MTEGLEALLAPQDSRKILSCAECGNKTWVVELSDVFVLECACCGFTAELIGEDEDDVA